MEIALVAERECDNCGVLEERLRERNSALSRALRDVERLTDRATPPARATSVLEPDRHWSRVTCDRCRASLEVSTSLRGDESERDDALLFCAVRLGWRISSDTAVKLGVTGKALVDFVLQDKDHCPACRRTMEGR